MMQWKITITKFKKVSKEIPKELRRYSIAVGYVKKWAKVWQGMTTKEFTFDFEDTSEKRIKEYANTAWRLYFKNQPKQILIHLGGELKYGKDNLNKFYFT